MNVLVDTSIWSLAFRKKEKTKEEERIVNLLAEYTRDLKVKIMGPIRQEILSGISSHFPCFISIFTLCLAVLLRLVIILRLPQRWRPDLHIEQEQKASLMLVS